MNGESMIVASRRIRQFPFVDFAYRLNNGQTETPTFFVGRLLEKALEDLILWDLSGCGTIGYFESAFLHLDID